MISQLEGLVKALRGGTVGKNGVFVVVSGDGILSGHLARGLAREHSHEVLQVVLNGTETGTPDCASFLQEKCSLRSCGLTAVDGVFATDVRSGLEFSTWSSGELSRRLLASASESSAPWKQAVFSVQPNVSEGALTLLDAANAILFEIPDGAREQASAYALLKSSLERKPGALLGLCVAPGTDESMALPVGKAFLKTAMKKAGAKASLLGGRGPAAVVEFLEWNTANLGK